MKRVLAVVGMILLIGTVSAWSDDFSSDTSTNYNYSTEWGGSWYWQNNELSSGSNAWSASTVYNISEFSYGLYHADFNFNGTANKKFILFFGRNNTYPAISPTSSDTYFVICDQDVGRLGLGKYVGGTLSYFAYPEKTWNDAQWYNVTIDWKSSGAISLYLDSILIYTEPAETTFTSGYFGIHTNNPYLRVDNLSAIPYEIATYPLPYIDDRKILPFSDTALPTQGSTLSINITPDQFEAASFVAKLVKTNTTLTDTTVTATELSDGAGHTIPVSALDIKVVKVWYQEDDDGIGVTTPGYYLTPELLLNNDSIIRVNYADQTNEIWIKNATFEGYIHIDNTSIGAFPDDAQVYDNATPGGFPQPFNLSLNENKQIWITTHAPSGQAAGNYAGKIWINSSFTEPTYLDFTVRVLPFSLDASSLDYGLYYRGVLPTSDPPYYNLTSENKTSAQMGIELQNMKNHGVLYPTLYQPDDTKLETALSLWDTVGFPADKIYSLGLGTGNSTDPATLVALGNSVTAYRAHTTPHGYTDLYIYGMDEVSGSVLLSERTAWETVHTAGGKVFVAGDGDMYGVVGDLLDTVVFARVDTSQATKWHSTGKLIYSYNNPQVGVENAETYRKNYGLGLWRSGYDGSMDYAYQHMFGQSIWNDYDSDSDLFRDHVFAYPKTNGVIDTIQWEGWREGVDDTRYAGKLTSIKGSNVAAMAITNNGIAKGDDMAIIREDLINGILGGTIPPAAEFTAYPTSGHSPLTVTFADLSENSPTSWNWSIPSRNLLTYSEEFDNAAWTKSGISITPDDTDSPNGTITADLSEVTGGGRSIAQTKTIPIGGTLTASIYLKAGTSDTVSFGIYDGGWVGQTGNILSGNGSLSDDQGTLQTITGLSATNWTRVSTTINQGSVRVDPYFIIYPGVSLGDTVYLWGAQLDGSEVATSYVTTNGSAIPPIYFSSSPYPSYAFDNGTYTLQLTVSNAEGSSTKTKYGYISVHDPDAANPETGINSIIAALTLFSIMLIGIGCLGIIYTLGSIGGYVGEQSNNGLIMISSVGAIAIGSILLILTYAIVSPIATVVGV